MHEVRSSSSSMEDCRVCRKTTMKGRTETPVLVRLDDIRLPLLEPYRRLLKLPQIHFASGITKVALRRFFYVMSSTWSDKSVQVPRRITIASTVDVPDLVTTAAGLSDEWVKKKTDSANDISL